jgi:hypothetical protein
VQRSRPDRLSGRPGQVVCRGQDQDRLRRHGRRAGLLHLLVFIPSADIGSECFAVSQTAATKDSGSPRGFSNIEFGKIKASYDQRRGLLLTVPYSLYNPDGGKGKPGTTDVRVDLSGKGSVKIER